MLLSAPGVLRRKKYPFVLLDAGQTLFKAAQPIRARYAQVAGRYGLKALPEVMEKAFLQAYQEWILRHPLSELTSDEIEKQWWRELARDLFRPFGQLNRFDDCFEELFQVFAHADAWRLFPEVTGFLSECRRRGVRLGIVSNWDSRLKTICRELGWDQVFDCIVYSAGAGVAKPNAGIFHQALWSLGAGPGEAVHVGDSWQDDVLGARAAGVDAVWLQRPEAKPNMATATAGSLTDILELC